MFSHLAWCIPFCIILFSIALCPQIYKDFWHKHSFMILFAITTTFVMVVYTIDAQQCVHLLLHTIFVEYLPFLLMISALYCASSGIYIAFPRLIGPSGNTIFLLGGSLLAGWIGTTGASMLLLRPFLRNNSHRKYRTHLVIFFIIMISNVGGAASPLGDPPLFIGFLNGVKFFWFSKNLMPYIALALILLAIIFFITDKILYDPTETPQHNNAPLCKFQGFPHVLLLACVPLSIITCTTDNVHYSICGAFTLRVLIAMITLVMIPMVHLSRLKWSVTQAIHKLSRTQIVLYCTLLFLTLLIALLSHMPSSTCYAPLSMAYCDIVRNLVMLFIICAACLLASKDIWIKNNFSTAPIKEVAEVFFAIFITVTPVLEMLHQGANGPLQAIFKVLAPNGEFIISRVFWVSGLLSSLLDNAPTFLMFFHAAGGDANVLMTSMRELLIALSLATVYFGALTYIGNAPNIMVKNIAERDGVNMPSFHKYTMSVLLIMIPILSLIILLI